MRRSPRLAFAPPTSEPARRGAAPARAAAIAGTPAAPYASVCPLWARLFEAAPVPPLAVGALVAAALGLVFFALDLLDGNLATLLSGEVAPWRHVEVRSAVVVSTLLAGVIVMHRYEELGSRRDVEKLAPQLARVAEPAGWRLGPRAAGAIGAALIVAIVPMLYVVPARFLLARTYTMPSVLFDLAVGAVLGWTTFKTLFATLSEDRRFAQLAGCLRSIELLDLSPLYVFGQRGLRRALRWLLLVSIASLVFFDAGKAAPPAVVLTGIFSFASFSFLLPVWGVHRHIRAQKQRELATLRVRIAAERSRLRAAGWAPAYEGGHFADLLAYEARVSATKTWPFDASTLVRLGLYACLPIGSWLGSALVQHVIESLLR